MSKNMNKKMIVVTKDYPNVKYEEPDVYPVDGDSSSESDERASAILGMLYHNYLEAEEQETTIPIDHSRTFCEEDHGYAQITWENGDVHRYFLTETQEIPGFEDTEYSDDDVKNKEDEDIPWSGQVLSLSTVHVMPETVDFLANPINSDMLQIFPNRDSCVMHVTDAESALKYDLPLCLKDCIRYAWKHDCPWIYFGLSGKERPGLPTYRSAWDKI